MSNRLREIDNKLTIVGLISKIFEGAQLPKRLLILMPSFHLFGVQLFHPLQSKQVHDGIFAQ